MKKKLKVGEKETVCNETFLVVKWRDERDVFILTSVHSNTMSSTGKVNHTTQEDIVKLTAIVEQNKHMGGADFIDRQLATCESVRKTMKQYKKLFFHCMDLAMMNTIALYRMEIPDDTKTVAQLKHEIIREILSTYKCNIMRTYLRSSNSINHPYRLTARHFLSKLTNKKQCVVCSKNCIRKRTIYVCTQCAALLCHVPCFGQFHTKVNY